MIKKNLPKKILLKKKPQNILSCGSENTYFFKKYYSPDGNEVAQLQIVDVFSAFNFAAGFFEIYEEGGMEPLVTSRHMAAAFLNCFFAV